MPLVSMGSSKVAKEMGITTLVEQGQVNDRNLAFGPRGTDLWRHAPRDGRCLRVLANQGIRTEPMAILRIVGPDGSVLEENRP